MTAHPAESGGATAVVRSRRRYRSIRTRLGYLLISVILVVMTVVGVSYVRALVAPGYATFADKTSAWLRDHGAGPVVDQIEAWYYTRHAPSRTPADTGQFAVGVAAAGAAVVLPTLPTPAGALTAPHWQIASVTPSGTPAVYTSRFEPDPTHPSVVTGAAVISTAATTLHLMLGTSEPRSALNTSAAQIPPGDVRSLAAVFNSGFRFGDITGGVYANGRTYRALQNGQATAAIDDQGHLTVGTWGRDLTLTRHLVAARQNLELIVDHAQPLPRPGSSAARWGGTHLQYQYTWRSGMGIDRHNNIVYVAGNHLTLSTLAVALADAGAIRGMELDMHSGMSLLTTWRTTATGPAPTKLLSTMPSSATRYLEPDRRDFFYATTTPRRTPPPVTDPVGKPSPPQGNTR